MVSVARLLEGLPPKEEERVLSACRFAEEHLSGISRRSGQNYALHGMEVGNAVKEADDMLIPVAVLHDILMHPEGERLLAVAPLTDHERSLVMRMHGLRRLHIDENTKDLDQVIAAFTEEQEILLLRMAHRLNDVRTLQRFSRDLRRSIARETLHMYCAIAGRVGLHRWRYEMEDICFQELEPKAAQQLREEFSRMKKADHLSLERTMAYLQSALQSEGVHADFSFRIKGLYSTYQKMLLKKRRFEELTDRLAVRIVVRDIPACYRALGIVHGRMHPIPGKLKDYIGAPKENGYRSIHTVIYPLPGITDQAIEIQIRTPAMQRECDLGIAAHHQYKDFQYALTTNQARVDLFRNLAILREEVSSPEQYEHALRSYFDQEHLVLFDAHNHIYRMPKPATALDFIAHVYGNRSALLKDVRINGRVRPFMTLLHDGDTIEASFGRTRRVSPAWMKQCQRKTTKTLLRNLSRKQESRVR